MGSFFLYFNPLNHEIIRIIDITSIILAIIDTIQYHRKGIQLELKCTIFSVSLYIPKPKNPIMSKIPNGIPTKGIIQGKKFNKPTITYASVPNTPSIVPYVIHANRATSTVKQKRITPKKTI